jgi:hypothetical protein
VTGGTVLRRGSWFYEALITPTRGDDVGFVVIGNGIG